jgi:hypothetical protein
MIWLAGEESLVLAATRVEHILGKIQMLLLRPAIQHCHTPDP